MKIVLLISAILLFSCNGKDVKSQKNLNKNLFTFVKENINKEDSTIHLDSLRILKFDTITQNSLFYNKITSIYDEIDKNGESIDQLLNERKTMIQIANLNASLDKILYNNYVDEVNQKKKEIADLMKQDTVFIKTADSLTAMLKTADSTKLLFFEVKCLIQYQRKDLSIKKDTVFAYLNPEKDIVRREDVFK